MMKAKQLPNFVAIDGEGRNASGIGSEHLYTLLASSLDDYAEDVDSGISTSECFDFLLTQKINAPTAVFVGFSINYDVNMWLRNLPKLAITDLWQTGRCYWQDHVLQRAYKIQYVPSKWFDLTWYEYPSEEKKTIQHIRIWDVWGFFQCSFVKALRDWLPELKAVIANIERMKEQRGEFNETQEWEIRAYCLEECRLLVQIMDKLAAALWDAGLPLSQWHGAGAIASKMLRQHKIKESLAWDIWPETVKDASCWAYFGGRVEIFKQGILPGPIYDYDIRSAYPDRIALLPTLIDGEWTEVGPGFSTNYRYALIHCRWDTRTHRDAWLAPFPQHFEGGRVAWEPVGEGWYHIEEWREAKIIFDNCIDELQALVFIPDNDHMPFSFVGEMYERKAAYKREADPRYYPLKIGLNALYGKLAQSMTRNTGWGAPPYQNYYLAGKVTAGVRARMLRALYQCGKEHAVMVATDGLFCTKRMPRCVEGERMGQWELTMAPDGMTLVQAGVFWEPGDEKARRRTRGFGVKSVSYAEASALFSPPFVDHKYTETRFIGMGYCTSTGDWSNWRRWIEVKRKLSADLLPHHKLQDGLDDACQWDHVVQAILHDPARRRPYLTKSERMATPDEEQLEAIVAAEQPQGAGQ